MRIKFLLCASLFILTLLMNKSLFANIDSLQQVDLSQLTGRVVTVDDPEYNVARLSWNLYFSRYPLAIVFNKMLSTH